MNLRRFALILGLTVVAAPAWPDTIRCGTSLVSEASTVSEILAKCGQPAAKSVSEVEPVVRQANGFMQKLPTVRTEVWTYERGHTSFPVKVTIIDGKVTKMEVVK